MIETDEFLSSNNDSLLTDPMTISAAYLKMKTLCINISHEIQGDIKIHNQNILPRYVCLPLVIGFSSDCLHDELPSQICFIF